MGRLIGAVFLCILFVLGITVSTVAAVIYYAAAAAIYGLGWVLSVFVRRGWVYIDERIC